MARLAHAATTCWVVGVQAKLGQAASAVRVVVSDCRLSGMADDADGIAFKHSTSKALMTYRVVATFSCRAALLVCLDPMS